MKKKYFLEFVIGPYMGPKETVKELWNFVSFLLWGISYNA